MSTPQHAIKTFQVHSVGAFIGFLALLVQALLRKYREWKNQARVDSPVMLSGVSCGEELREPNILHDGLPRPGDAQYDQEGDKSIRDKIQGLLCHVHLPESETTSEITCVAVIYLQATVNLLRVGHGGEPGSTGAGRTRAELHAAAGEIIRDAASLTNALLPPSPPDKGRRAPQKASWAVSLCMTGLVGATMAAKSAEYMVFGGQSVDLTRFTLLGEPRAATDLDVIADAMSAAGSAFFNSTRDLIRLVIQIAMVPLYAAFDYLVSALLPVGLPLSIVAVSIISLLAILMMASLADKPSDGNVSGSERDDVDKQEEDIGR